MTFFFLVTLQKSEMLSGPTTFSGQFTRGTLSWYSAGEGTDVVSVGCCCVDFGLSLVDTAVVDSGTAALAAAVAPVTAVGATAWAVDTEMVAVVELGGLSLVEASPSPSTRLPTAGWDMLGFPLPPRLPVLLRRSSAPSGLERVRGRSSTRRSSPSAWPGSGVSIDKGGSYRSGGGEVKLDKLFWISKISSI